MRSELQRLIDGLGDRLGCSVAMDDARMRLQVYSPHRGPVDQARIGSILHREVPEEWIEWARSLGVSRTCGPMRIPPNPALGFAYPRVCVPIRYENTLLGYLFLIDENADLTEEELAIAEDCAAEAAAILYQEQARNAQALLEEREMARDLLAADQNVRDQATRRAVDLRALHPSAPVTAIVARVDPEKGQALSPSVDTSLLVAVDRATRVLPARESLHLVRNAEAIVLLSQLRRGSAIQAGELASRLHDQAAKTIGSPARIVVGIGEEQPSLSSARISYAQASHAATVALTVDGAAPVLAWHDLGVYRYLCRLPLADITIDDLPAGLVRLCGAVGGEDLLMTLECYLDHAGAAKETAAKLFLHRTSLYSRLSRIEKIADVDLDNGADRLELHLGLRLAKVAGIDLRHVAALRAADFRTAN
ncbi:MAG TPA: helix-turn-helix domain-containing protein [Streptosporangiaceae bacterium]|nr:helix-turn-helix domain-containing protein [Streptosporangiaceae bacterium]